MSERTDTHTIEKITIQCCVLIVNQPRRRVLQGYPANDNNNNRNTSNEHSLRTKTASLATMERKLVEKESNLCKDDQSSVNRTGCFDPGQGHSQLECLGGFSDVSLLPEDPRPDQVIEGVIPDLGNDTDTDTTGVNDRQGLTIHNRPSFYCCVQCCLL